MTDLTDKLREFYAARIERLMAEHKAGTHGECEDGCDYVAAWGLAIEAIRTATPPPELVAEIERDRIDAEKYRSLSK